MKKTLYSLLSLGILGIATFPAYIHPLAATESQQLAQATTSQTTFEGYRQECMQRAKREGLTADVANDLCNCTIKKFRERYTLVQFRDLVQKSKTNRTAARSLSQVGETCFDEVLYE